MRLRCVRSFSGRITKDTPLYIIPYHNELRLKDLLNHSDSSVIPTAITTPIQLYFYFLFIIHRFLLMGREIIAVDEVPAGNIFGVYGLEGSIMKMGTLSNNPDCPCLSSLRLAVGNQFLFLFSE